MVTRFIGSKEAAETIGVPLETLSRWELLGCGPAPHSVKAGIRTYQRDTVIRFALMLLQSGTHPEPEDARQAQLVATLSPAQRPERRRLLLA